VSAWRDGREVVPGVGVSPLNRALTTLSDRRDSCVSEACSLFILDKGKPVARPGRKAKGRRIVSGGSQAAEGMMCIVSASDDEEVCCYCWDPEGETQAGAGGIPTGASPEGPKIVFSSGWLPLRCTTGMEEYP
jgi:hypothetical protein